MARRIAKWLGWGLVALILMVAIFVAFNWRLVSNIARVGQPTITQVERFSPAQMVAGCPSELEPIEGTAIAANFAAMREFSDKYQGRGLIVLKDGKLAAQAFAPGVAAEQRTLSLSMHKTVVALAVGAAIDERIIPSADTPIGTYIPEWADDPRGKLSFRQLLGMASGLKNLSMTQGDFGAMQLMLGDVTDAALSVTMERSPGTFNYSNADFQLAGMALNRAIKAAGKGDYASFLSQRLWCPLGNADASLWLEGEGGEPRYYSYLDAQLADWARVGELIRLGGMWQNRQLVPAEWIAAMRSPGADNPNYGLGMWIGSPWAKQRRYSREVELTATHSEAYLADDVIFLDGYGGQRVYIIPSAAMVIARVGELEAGWDDAPLVNLALSPVPPDYGINLTEAAARARGQ